MRYIPFYIPSIPPIAISLTSPSPNSTPSSSSPTSMPPGTLPAPASAVSAMGALSNLLRTHSRQCSKSTAQRCRTSC